MFKILKRIDPEADINEIPPRRDGMHPTTYDGLAKKHAVRRPPERRYLGGGDRSRRPFVACSGEHLWEPAAQHRARILAKLVARAG